MSVDAGGGNLKWSKAIKKSRQTRTLTILKKIRGDLVKSMGTR